MYLGSAVVTAAPWLLLALAIVPWLWWVSRRSYSGLERGRRFLSLTLRAAVVLLLLAALAELQWVQRSDRVAVLYLLDRSLSVSPQAQQQSVEYVNRSIQQHRNAARGDKAGVIGFGTEAAVEAPPLAANLHVPDPLEVRIDPGHTDLAAALRLARAAIPPDSAARVVILSDGNENRGDALEQARALTEAGVGIDVIPLINPTGPDVAMQRLAVPPATKAGAPFDVRVVLSNTGGSPPATIAGKLRIVRSQGEQRSVLVDQQVSVAPGTQLFSFRDTLDEPDFYTYEALFVPANAAADAISQNNRVTGFTALAGPSRVLLIEDWSEPGHYRHFIERLEAAGLTVDVQPSNRLFTSLAQLQRYDAVILAGVPRISGTDAETLADFSDRQIEMLVQNTQRLGAGLILLGGPAAMGAGGWAGTPLEAAMPVDFQIKNLKVQPQGALMLVIDRSGSMSGEKLQMCKAAAREAVRVLNHNDFIGVVAFDSQPQWVVQMQMRGEASKVVSRINRISEGGGTDMYPGMVEGFKALRSTQATIKHMIVLTDGQTPSVDYRQLMQEMRAANITVSTVAVGPDASVPLLRQIAAQGQGKNYVVRDPKIIPRIFVKEATRVSRPLVYEDHSGFAPVVHRSHEAIDLEEPLPPLTGVVLTSPKDNPLVEIPWEVPVPQGSSSPLLATWNYGLGRAAVFASDASSRWSQAWTNWEHYDRVFVQLVRWAARPAAPTENFQVTSEYRDGKLRVILNGMTDEGPLDLLPAAGIVTGPDMESREIAFAQIAPGRYLAEVPVAGPGVHFVNVLPGAGYGPIRVGVDVPYSAEFRQRETNRRFLAELASLTPRGGQSGRVIIAEAYEGRSEQAGNDVDAWLATDVFRGGLQPVESRQSVWPRLIFLAGCLFLIDVLIRRVRFGRSLEQLAEARRKRLEQTLPSRDSHLGRLQQRKAEVADDLDRRRQAWQSAEPFTEQPVESSSILEPVEQPLLAPQTSADRSPEDEAADTPHTSRLLEAKRRLWEER